MSAEARARPYVLHVALAPDDQYLGDTLAGPLGDTVPGLLRSLREQLDRGWGVGLACSSLGPLGPAARALGVEVFWTTAGELGATVANSAPRISALLSEIDPELLHLHGSRAALAGRLVGRRRAEMIMTVSDWPFEYGGALRRRLARSWEQMAGSWTAHVICGTEAAAAMARTNRLHVPLTVLPVGVDLSRLHLADEEQRRESRSRLGLADVPTVVSLAGPRGTEDAHRLAAAAWRQVSPAHPDAALVLVDDAATPTRAPNHGDDPAGVRYHGARTDLADWFAAADLVVFPALPVGVWTAPLMAMAVGRSVVAPAQPSAAELVPHDCGAMVPEGDVDKLAQAISVRLNSPAVAADEGDHGWHHVAAHRDAAEAARRVAQLSLGVMGRRSRRA